MKTNDDPWQKSMRDWSIHEDVDKAIDWNRRRQRRERAAKLLAYATAFIMYGGVIALIVWMLVSYPIEH